MTIRDVLNLGLDSEILLAHVLKKDKSWLYANPDKSLSNIQYSKFNLLIGKRAKHWPVAYLTGHKEFFGLDFQVSPATLIPRPETELLVERALLAIRDEKLAIGNVVDIGTGSGAIIITLWQKLAAAGISHNFKFYATDISSTALKIARDNARRHEVLEKIKFVRGDLLDPLLHLPLMRGRKRGGHSLAIANLPYLTPAQIKSNPDLRREPRSALVAGKDGLKYYRELFKQLSQLPNPNSQLLLLEHDPSQVSKLKSLAKKYFPKAKPISHRDLSDNPRVLELDLQSFRQ